MEKIWLRSYQPGVPAEIGLDEHQSLGELFERSVARFRDRPAFVCMGAQLTYGELDRLSRDFACYLQNTLALPPGTRIALMMPNILQYPVCLFGALRAGYVVVNCNPLYTARELEHQLKDSGAEAIVVLENVERHISDGLPPRKATAKAMQEVAALVATSMEQYGVKTGGEKGNVTLTSFDGKYKLVRQMQDRLVFGEQLLAAKALIDECVQAWSKDANDNIRALVNHAFQTDKEGKINTGRVLGLRSLDIQDEAWKQAMQAIADSTKTASTTPYVRFYERDEGTGEYKAISLDVAAV